VELAWRTGADGFVTTEKDAVKLTEGMRERLETNVGPVVAPQLRVGFADAEVERAASAQLMAMLERNRGAVAGGGGSA
jgi:tetraacyldisaccharide 4'-kinase